MTLPPAPSLLKLVQKWGGYDRIPQEVWIKYDAAVKRWQDAVSAGDHWLAEYRKYQQPDN